MDVHTKVWMEHAGVVALSHWRVALLETIGATGSLAAAARQMRVPYRTAWQKLKTMEAQWGRPLVVAVSGGEQGGGMALTPFAQELIRRFHSVAQDVEAQVAARFADLFQGDLPAPPPASP